MARKMTNKQQKFLVEFEKNNRINDQAERLMNGNAPYKGSVHMLQVDHLSESQWMELVGMNDYETLWSDANRFLNDLSIQKKS